MNDSLPGAMVEDLGRQREEPGGVEELLGALHFNNALKRIDLCELAQAQAQLDLAKELLPSSRKAQVVFLQTKVAVLQGDRQGVDRYLGELDKISPMTPEQEQQREDLLRYVPQVEVFRDVLPLYAVVDRTVRLIGALFRTTCTVTRKLAMAINFVARMILRGTRIFVAGGASGIRKGSAAFLRGLRGLGSVFRSFAGSVSKWFAKSDSGFEKGNEAKVPDVPETGFEVGQVVNDLAESPVIDGSISTNVEVDMVKPPTTAQSSVDSSQSSEPIPELSEGEGVISSIQPELNKAVSNPEENPAERAMMESQPAESPAGSTESPFESETNSQTLASGPDAVSESPEVSDDGDLVSEHPLPESPPDQSGSETSTNT